jgi:hypothetical protein
MAASTKKRPPFELEPGEGKAHEMQESPAEEVREGSEPDDAPKSKGSRKRSAKNAKNTKAPMDGDCGCGGKKGASCDGGCGSGYAKKMDALSPQEYLAACDLGIQHRSRAYIRARLDAAERLDLKCGKGSISEGEKCSKGAAQKVASGPGRIERQGWYGTSKLGGDPFSYKNLAAKSAALNGAVLGGYGAGIGAAVGGARGSLIGAGAGAAFGVVGGALAGAAQAGINRATSNAAKRRRLTREFEAPIAAKFKEQRAGIKAQGKAKEQEIASKYKQERAALKQSGASRKQIQEHDMKAARKLANTYDRTNKQLKASDTKTAMRLHRGYDKIGQSIKGRYGADSVYATGFSTDLSQLAI